MNKYASKARESQDRNRKYRQCDSKKPYPSLEAAQSNGMETYECPHCGLWHRTGKIPKLVGIIRSRGYIVY